MNAAPTSTTDVNLAVLRGRVAHDPTRRELPSGGIVLQFDVATQRGDGERPTTISTPVSWHEPPSAATAALVEGGGVVVIGSVRRRFFRVGGATQSRTEIVADRVIPVRRRKQVDGALRAVVEGLQASVT